MAGETNDAAGKAPGNGADKPIDEASDKATNKAAGKASTGPRRRGRPKSAAASAAGDGGPEGATTGTVIKKYANRRLYDTGASRYVTLDDLAVMVREGRHFTVVDAKSGEDITRPVLGQIIFEQEAKDGPSLLPTEFLRQVISYYGDGMGAVVPSYLEASMRAFERGAEEMRAEMGRVAGQMAGGEMPDPAKMMGAGMEAGMAGFTAPLKLIEEQTRRNQEAFASAMRLFTPFGAPKDEATKGETTKDETSKPGAPETGAAATPEPPPGDDLAALREQIGAMQRKLDRMGD